jgi:hypothetical protein
MVFDRVLIFAFMLSLTSCSSSLKINPGECGGEVVLGRYLEGSKLKNKKDFIIEDKILTSFSFKGNSEVIYLDQFLKENEIDCSRVKSLSLLLKNTWSDVLISLIPFMTRSTLVVSGEDLKLSQKNYKKDEVRLTWIKKNVVNLLR